MTTYRDALTKLFLKGSFKNNSDFESELIKHKQINHSTYSINNKLNKNNSIKKVSNITQPGDSFNQSISDYNFPNINRHPGIILAEMLRKMGFTASDVARDTHVPVNRITALINGQRGITADSAIRLAYWFGNEPEYWINLQLSFELSQARKKLENEIQSFKKLVDYTE
jgi:addiction module HigA family antidote